MKIWKWICFILICTDTISYVTRWANKVDNVGTLIGLMTGIVARVCALYGTAAYWVFA